MWNKAFPTFLVIFIASLLYDLCVCDVYLFSLAAPSPPPLPQFVEGSIKPTEMTILLTKSSDSNGRVV